MRRTKIVCTLGPATWDVPVLRELIRAGMDVARINMSHGSRQDNAALIAAVRRAAREEKKNLAIMLDTKGPEIRIGKFEGGKVFLEEGQEFVLTTKEITGNRQAVSVDYPGITRDVKPGLNILLADGLIVLEIMAVGEEEIRCRVTSGGELSDNKG